MGISENVFRRGRGSVFRDRVLREISRNGVGLLLKPSKYKNIAGTEVTRGGR